MYLIKRINNGTTNSSTIEDLPDVLKNIAQSTFICSVASFVSEKIRVLILINSMISQTSFVKYWKPIANLDFRKNSSAQANYYLTILANSQESTNSSITDHIHVPMGSYNFPNCLNVGRLLRSLWILSRIKIGNTTTASLKN